MRIHAGALVAVVMTFVGLGLGSRCSAEDIAPPGPPGSDQTRMKSLNEVEPRTYISALPYDITNSGSFYLAGSLVGESNQNGIVIMVDHVQLDLNGFSLIGETGSLYGITFAPETNRCKNVTIRNGVVTGWGLGGIYAKDCMDSRIENVLVALNGYPDGNAGIFVGENFFLKECTAIQNSGAGIQQEGISGSIRDCVARWNFGTGIAGGGACRVTDCGAYWNMSNGIAAGDLSTVRDCTAIGNWCNGISVGDNCVVMENLCQQNGGSTQSAGITGGSGSRVEGNSVSANWIGIYFGGESGSNLVVRNTARGNDSEGYSISSENYYGQILTNGVIGPNFTDSNPWANFAQ